MTLIDEVESLNVKAPEPLDVAKPEADDERFWSVTTINGVLDKPGIPFWKAKEAAKAAVRIAGTLPERIKEDGEDAVIKWLRDASDRSTPGNMTASDLGTAVHAACEAYALTGIRPTNVDPEVLPFLDQFDKWAQVWQPAYQAAELTVYSRQYGYAGTCDGFLTIDGQRLIIDYKTTRNAWTDHRPPRPTVPYPEVGTQLAAYRYAEMAATWRARRFEKQRRRYYLLNADEVEMSVPVPKVDGGLCIHITPEHCNAHPVRCDESIFEAFLYLIEAFRFQSEISKTIVGDRLVHPSEVPA